jgi:hypothetical protein
MHKPSSALKKTEDQAWENSSFPPDEDYKIFVFFFRVKSAYYKTPEPSHRFTLSNNSQYELALLAI